MKKVLLALVALTGISTLSYAQVDYVVGPQDVLTVTVFGEAELSGKYTVEQDGTFTFPQIGRVKGGGMTLRGLELNFTQKTVARPVVAPPGVPADRVAALRAAFAALATDQEFLGDAERSKLEIAPVGGEAVDKIIALIASAPPALAEHYAKTLAGARTK